MSDSEIKALLKRYRNSLAEHQSAVESDRQSIKNIQKLCPHRKRETWTNNDGDGRFAVERCLVCGLQRDGGLG